MASFPSRRYVSSIPLSLGSHAAHAGVAVHGDVHGETFHWRAACRIMTPHNSAMYSVWPENGRPPYAASLLSQGRNRWQSASPRRHSQFSGDPDVFQRGHPATRVNTGEVVRKADSARASCAVTGTGEMTRSTTSTTLLSPTTINAPATRPGISKGRQSRSFVADATGWIAMVSATMEAGLSWSTLKEIATSGKASAFPKPRTWLPLGHREPSRRTPRGQTFHRRDQCAEPL